MSERDKDVAILLRIREEDREWFKRYAQENYASMNTMLAQWIRKLRLEEETRSNNKQEGATA